jgi:hypothetical protein
LTGWFVLASLFALPMIGVDEGAGDVGCLVAFCCWFFFCCLTIASGFFWKLIVLGYLWMALCWALFSVCFCLVAMSSGVGCAVGAWVGVPFGAFVLGVLAWCLVILGG